MKIFLKPGELYIGKGPAVISTILGSCVSVTMFNKRLKVGGICHALLPKDNLSNNAGYFRYVDSSISHMLREFEGMGIKRQEIEVKVFGGSDVIGAVRKKSVGQANIEAAIDILNDKGLNNILPSDAGGVQGRKIIFHTHTGRVLLKKLERIRNLS